MYGAESGGSQAAKLLKEAATKHIAEHHSDIASGRITARVYANLKELSTNIVERHDVDHTRLKLPHYPRALGAFAAGFSRADVWFDYTNVVEEEDVERKITGMCQSDSYNTFN